MDQYDEQIQFLIANPKMIEPQWYAGNGIFQFCKRGDHHVKGSGCLTMVQNPTYRTSFYQADEEMFPGLTARIRADSRIPSDSDQITAENLPTLGPIFAEYHREMDRLAEAYYAKHDTTNLEE